MSCNTQTFNLGVRNILLGKDTKQTFCITTKADSSGSLNNKYFVVHEPNTNAKHVFWYNIATLGVAPTVPNATLHVIAAANNATATAIATATQAVLAALGWIDSATQDGKHIEVVLDVLGPAYEARDGFLTNKTGFTITVTQFGSVQTDLGATAGDTTLAFEEQLKDITSPQTGDFILAQLRRGVGATVSFELKDTSIASIRRVLGFYGSTIVQDDADSTVVSGYGSKNLFKSTDDIATQLVLRPTSLADESDPSEDFTFLKMKLKLGELTLSAENELVLPVEATCYLDQSRNAFTNFFVYGDASKVPLAD
jgi:hypothetical protein